LVSMKERYVMFLRSELPLFLYPSYISIVTTKSEVEHRLQGCQHC